jgi:hypothetical protein
MRNQMFLTVAGREFGRRRGGLLGVLFLLLVLMASFVSVAGAASVTASPLGDVSRHEAFTGQVRHAHAVDQPGRRAAMVGALGIGADGELRLRSGGSGVLTVSLARQVGTPVRVAGQRVRIAVPRQYRAGSVKAAGWNCRKRGTAVVCGAARSVPAGSLGPIEIGLRAAGAGKATIAVDATWRQRHRRYSTSGTARFRVRAPMKLRAAPSATSVLSPAPGLPAAPIVLRAHLGRSAKGLPVSYRWRQVCRGRCARVDWLTPTSGQASERLATAQVRVPRVKRATRLRFAITARSWRGTATATTSVLVRPQANVRLRSPKRLRLAHPKRHRGAGAKADQQVTRALASVGTLGDAPATGARFGEAADHRATGGPAPRAEAGFVVAAARSGGAAGSGSGSASSGAAAGAAGSRGLVTRDRFAPLDATAIAADANEDDSFCSLWDDGDEAAFELADGTGVALGDATHSGGDCDDDGATIKFTGGTLEASDVVFVDLSGSVTADGLRIRSGALRRPAGWSDQLPAKLAIELPEAAAFGAELGDDGWGSLRARVELDEGLELLPLPAGWYFPKGESVLAFEPLQGVFNLHGVARAPKGSRGEVRIEGSLEDGTSTATVEAEDLAVLRGTGTNAVALSGKGEVTAEAGPEGGTVSGSVYLATDAGTPVRLAGGVEVEDAVADWDDDGIALGGKLRVQSKNGSFEAQVDGSFVSTSEWKLEVGQTAPFVLAEGVMLEGVHGLLGRAGEDPFAIELSGTVAGWEPSPQLSGVSVTGRLTNVCAEDAKNCKAGQVRLAMEVRGKAHVLSQTIPWEGEAEVNLKTMALRFSAGAKLSEFGPAALALTGVELRMTNEGPQWCTAPGASASAAAPGPTATPAASSSKATDAPEGDAAEPDEAPGELTAAQELSFSVTGDGRVLSQPFRAQAELASSGYCLAGTFGEFRPDGLTSAGRPLIDNARLLYATRDAEANLAGSTIAVKANQLRVAGDLNLPVTELPQNLRDVLGGRNELALTIARSEGSFSLDGSATFNFARPIYMIGDAAHPDEARLQARSAQLAFEFSSSSGLRLGLAARAALLTPANAAKNVPASTTPLFVAAGIDLGKPSVAVSAGVDTDDPAVKGGTVTNAFGQPELDVRKLVVAASLGADTSFGITADATLPSSWTSSLGMQARAPTRVVFSISQSNPCLELAVGSPPPADGSANPAPTVMRLGALSASYAQIMVAPTGCRIGGTVPGTPATVLEPGFGLGFDGQIGTAPVTFIASMRLEKLNFALKTKVRVGAFDAGPIRFRRTALDLDIEAGERRKVDVAFSGGLDLGESNIDVDGRFFADENRISAALKGNGRLKLGGRTFAEGRIDAALDFSRQGGGWKAGTAKVDAQTRVLGSSVGLIFAYQDGTVQNAAGAFEYAAGAGPAQLRAGVLFAYAPDGVSLRGNGCDVGQLAATGDKQVLLRLCGGLTVGSLRRDLQMTVGLPQRYDFDLRVPRSEVGVYVASVYLEGSLQASLQLGLEAPRFWVRDGYARAGGCLKVVWWSKCADGINVDFKPSTGRFEGTFLGFAVSWGSDSWRVAGAPGAEANEPQVGPADRVLLQQAAEVRLDQKAPGGGWRRNTYSPSRGLEVPASAVFDPDRRQITMLVPLPSTLRGSVPKPALGYLLTFGGVAFDGSRPRTTSAAGGARQIAYTSLSVARVSGGPGGTQSVAVERGGALTMGGDGLSLSWGAERDGPVPSAAESTLAGAVPRFVEDGLPLGVSLRFGAAEPSVESRAALEKRLG